MVSGMEDSNHASVFCLVMVLVGLDRILKTGPNRPNQVGRSVTGRVERLSG